MSSFVYSLPNQSSYDLKCYRILFQAVLASLQTLVVNMLMAPFLLQEKLTKLDMTATAVIFFGTVVSIIFGSKDSAELTINERESVVCIFCAMSSHKVVPVYACACGIA